MSSGQDHSLERLSRLLAHLHSDDHAFDLAENQCRAKQAPARPAVGKLVDVASAVDKIKDGSTLTVGAWICFLTLLGQDPQV